VISRSKPLRAEREPETAAHAFRPKADLRSKPAMTASIALRLLANEKRRDLGRFWVDRRVER
jgi:hypothetical protein